MGLVAVRVYNLLFFGVFWALTVFLGVWYTLNMNKKASKKRVGSKKRVVRKRSAATTVAVKKREKGVPIGFHVSRLGKRVRAVVYDRRDGREVLLRDIKYVPKWVRRELTDTQVAKFLLTDDAKR